MRGSSLTAFTFSWRSLLNVVVNVHGPTKSDLGLSCSSSTSSTIRFCSQLSAVTTSPPSYMSISEHFNLNTVYDVPLAVDPTTLRTRGLSPEHADERIKVHVKDARSYIVGPMPPNEFIGFLNRSDTSAMSSSRHAFRSVPSRAATPSEICAPLVSSHVALVSFGFE